MKNETLIFNNKNRVILLFTLWEFNFFETFPWNWNPTPKLKLQKGQWIYNKPSSWTHPTNSIAHWKNMTLKHYTHVLQILRFPQKSCDLINHEKQNP